MCNAHTATNQVFKSQTELKLSVEMMGEHLKTHIFGEKKEALEDVEGEQKRKAGTPPLIVTNVKSCCQTDQGHFFAPSKRP